MQRAAGSSSSHFVLNELASQGALEAALVLASIIESITPYR